MALNREAVIRAAEKYVSRGKLEAAIKEYRKVLAENPNDANTLNRVGDLYARTERYGEAVKLFTQIAEQYTRDGFFVKAIAIYKKIIKLDPTSLPVYERLAELYFKQGLLNEARTQYQVLADYYQKHDNATSATTIYQKMAEMEPENPSFHLKLAELFTGQRLHDKALAEYRRLADLLIVQGSIEEAAQVYEKAFRIGADQLDFVREVVLGLHDAGYVGAAARVLSKAVEHNPRAAALAAEIGFGQDQEETAAPAAPARAEPEPKAEEEPAEASFLGPSGTEGELELAEPDDAYVLPEVSFDDAERAVAELAEAQRAAAEHHEELGAEPPLEDEMPEAVWAFDAPGGFAAAGGAEVGTADAFSFDFEDDDVPDTLVEPPIDMQEAPGAGELVVELELEDDFEPAVEAAEALDLEALDLEPPTEAADEFDAEQAVPPSVRREEDLLAEARVFAKYGLQEKALDRLDELVESHPDHLEGLELRTRIHLETGRREEAISDANEVSRVALATGRLGTWSDLKDALIEAGYSVEESGVSYEPGERPAEDDRIAQLLEDLSLEDFDVSSAGAPAMVAEGRRETEDLVAEASPAQRSPRSVAGSPAAAAPPVSEPAPTRADKKLISLVEELGLEDLQDDAETAAVDAVAAGAGADSVIDDSGMSWLDDVGGGGSQSDEQAEALFDEEDDFFDLAAELERELTEDELAVEHPIEPQEQSLEDIIEGFKRGVAENLSAEDYETHYNLGIAYREMGLLDEAIGEFQLAAKDERYAVDCSSLLGNCFVEKGLPELAVRWYRKGLESPSINEETTAGLLYDMGNAYLSLGDSQAAYKTFVEVYGLNSNYRDVSDKIEALSPT